ncbi:MAG: hypothetical protein ACI35W_07165 [Anaeroplasmataceae bacterium]
MKKISRKLLMSILSMAFAVVALGTTTYAWFTMNATATADLKVNVQGGTNGVLLSTDGKTFSSDVTILTDSSNQALTGLELQPLTYDYATTPVATPTAFKKFSNNAIVEAGTGASSMYLQFDLYVCTSGPSQSVYFSSTGNTVESDYADKSYVILNDFSYDDGSFIGGTAVKVDAVNALRSIVEVYEGSEERDTMQKLCKGGQKPENAVEWGTSERVLNIFGFDNGVTLKAGNGSNTADDLAYNFGQTLGETNAANAYLSAVSDGALNGVSYPTEPTLTTGFGTEANAIYTSANTSNLVYRVRFTFWLEGFDADCFDAIMGQTLTINLSFTTERA